MAEVLTETDDDIIDEADIKIVGEPAPAVAVPPDPAQPPAAQEDDDDEDDSDDGDERLGESEEGESEEDRRKRKRRQQRDYRKRTRLRNEAELQELRAIVPSLMQRLAAVEGHTSASNITSLQQQLAQAEADAATALELHAQAIDAGNGADAARAQIIREQALARVNELKPIVQRSATPAPQQGPSPDAQRLATQWIEQNKGWYGVDPTATTLAKAIDAQVATEGFKPDTPAYWQEVTSRVRRALDEAGMLSKPQQRQPASPPPTGMGRQHAPASTKTEHTLSAERVQAMKDAGIWDDPVRRTKQIKAFQAYDRENGSPKTRG